MAVIDAILFNGEIECLDIRLHELAGVVDEHVIVEAAETFTGQPKTAKPLYLQSTFDKFCDRLTFVRVTEPVETSDPWQRETAHRNAILEGFEAWLPDDTIILIGDADEIPTAEAVRVAAGIAAAGIQVAFDQTLSTYYVNVVCKNMRWRGTQAVRYDRLKQATPQGVRDFRNHASYIHDAGWHFSSLVLDDPVGRMTAKIQAFSHQEVNRPEVLAPANIRRRVAMCQDIQGRTDVQFEIRRDAKLPKYVTENKDKFSLLYYPGSL